MQKSFLVGGYRPAFGQRVNEFIKACDLGTEGAFVPFLEVYTVTFKEDATQENIDNAPNAIKQAFQHVGCTSVVVYEHEKH